MQIDTGAILRNVREYNSSHTPRSRHLIGNLPRSLLYRRRISRLTSRDHLTPIFSLLNQFDATKIFAADSVDAISMEDARYQLHIYCAVDLIIEGHN